MMTKEEEKMMMEKLILLALLQVLPSLRESHPVCTHDVTQTIVTHNTVPLHIAISSPPQKETDFYLTEVNCIRPPLLPFSFFSRCLLYVRRYCPFSSAP